MNYDALLVKFGICCSELGHLFSKEKSVTAYMFHIFLHFLQFDRCRTQIACEPEPLRRLS
jgi:hypothetical protein